MNSGIWTLDSLFLLPKTRLKYYLKLYNRLLKNTDNRLLVGAVDTLNNLMDTLETRSTVRVGDQTAAPTTAAPLETDDEVVIDMRNPILSPPLAPPAILRPVEQDYKTGSETSSNHGSVSAGYVDIFCVWVCRALNHFSSRERSSRESESTSPSRASTQTLAMPISDLERRLATERTIDIFTMTPKVCFPFLKLQCSHCFSGCQTTNVSSFTDFHS